MEFLLKKISGLISVWVIFILPVATHGYYASSICQYAWCACAAYASVLLCFTILILSYVSSVANMQLMISHVTKRLFEMLQRDDM